MKIFFGFVSISVTVVTTLLTQSQAVFALSATQVGDIAEKTTVRIINSSDPSDSGSGVIIAKKDKIYYIRMALTQGEENSTYPLL